MINVLGSKLFDSCVCNNLDIGKRPPVKEWFQKSKKDPETCWGVQHIYIVDQAWKIKACCLVDSDQSFPLGKSMAFEVKSHNASIALPRKEF